MAAVNKQILLKIDNYDFEVDLNLLMSKSSYFNTMFNGSFIESKKQKIEIQGVNANIFRLILKNLNKPEIEFANNELIEVLKVAHLLQFDSIIEMCVQKLKKLALSTTYCLEVWKVAHDIFLPELGKIAKYMSLLEFETLKNSPILNSFELQLIFEYLSNSALHVRNEFDVFNVIYTWWSANNCRGSFRTLFILLSCIDFDKIEIVEIERMIELCDNKENQEAVQVLECMISHRNNCHYAEYPTTVKDNVQLLLKSQKRFIPETPCTVCLTYDYNTLHASICYFDPNSNEMKHLCDFPMLEQLEGYSLVCYKTWILVFGGQDTSTRIKTWNNSKFFKINFISKEIISLKSHEINLRDAKAILIHTKIYVTKTHDDDNIIFAYDINTDHWTEIRNCFKNNENIIFGQFENKLLVMSKYLNEQKALIYIWELKNWDKITIRDPKNLIDENTSTEYLFADNDYLYMKTKEAIIIAKCEANSNTLHILGAFSICSKSTTNNAICGTRNKILYSFHKHQFFLFTEELYLYAIDIRRQSMNEVEIRKNQSISNHVEWNLSVGSFAVFHFDQINETYSISNSDILNIASIN